MELERGTIVDRYTVHRELGRGGMAVVYLVQHNTLETLHALKVLTVGSHKIRDRLIQEGKVQAQLRHPNVVAVTDVLDVEGSPGLLMEFVEGPALDTWLLGKRLEVEQAEALFLGIVAGVERAHQLGIVHRDLKPANVMLSEGPEGWVPKVTDFGLAKALQEEGDIQRTRTGMPMGTPSYMSPEQIRDAKGVDQRTDVFALGCILYELTCGQRAFFGRDMLEIFNAVAQGKHTASTTLVPDMPPRLDTAINGCLVVDRERRIPDCATLRSVLKGELPWQVAPPSSPDATFDLFGGGDTAAQSEFVAAAQASLAQSMPSRPPPGGTFSLDELDEPAPQAHGTIAAPSVHGPAPQASMPPGFAGRTPTSFPHHSQPGAPLPPPPPREPSFGPPPPPPSALPWIGAALVVGIGLSAGVFVMVGRGDPPVGEPRMSSPAAAPTVPVSVEPPSSEPPSAEPPEVEPPSAEPTEVEPPTAEPPGVEPASIETPNVEPASVEPASVEPASAEPEQPPVSAPALTATVSFTGADSLQLEEVDFRHRFPAGEVPPGRYRILAGFGDADPAPAGDLQLVAGQRVRLECDPDFRRCRAR
jgi:serine/threonine protein kinase